jgi:hypothetical protein
MKEKAICLLFGFLFDLIRANVVWGGGMSEIGQRLSMFVFCLLDAIRGLDRSVQIYIY